MLTVHVLDWTARGPGINETVTWGQYTSLGAGLAIRCVPDAIILTEEQSRLSEDFICDILRLELPEDLCGDLGRVSYINNSSYDADRISGLLIKRPF